MKHGITPAMLRRAVRRAVAEGVRAGRLDALAAERDAAIRERDEWRWEYGEARAYADRLERMTHEALAERDEARRERDEAISERDEARRERDEARAGLDGADASVRRAREADGRACRPVLPHQQEHAHRGEAMSRGAPWLEGRERRERQIAELAEDFDRLLHDYGVLRDRLARAGLATSEGGEVDAVSELIQQRDAAVRRAAERDEARRSLTVADLDETLLGRLDALAAERDEARRERDEARRERDDAVEDAAHWLAQWEHARSALRGEP